MRFLPLALLAALLLTGCGIDKERVAAALATAEHQATNLQAFIAATAPQVEALSAAAADTGNPTAAAAAAKLLAAYEAARAALPATVEAIEAARATLASLEADAAGKVPWYAVAGGLVLTWLPRLAGMLIPALQPLAAAWANLHWNTAATPKQKESEA